MKKDKNLDVFGRLDLDNDAERFLPKHYCRILEQITYINSDEVEWGRSEFDKNQIPK